MRSPLLEHDKLLELRQQLFMGVVLMSLQELKQQAYKLSVSDGETPAIGDRLELISAIKPQPNRQDLINQMRGMLKNDQPPPNDAQVLDMLEEERFTRFCKN